MTPARLAALRVLLAMAGRRTTLASELEEQRGELADRRDRALLLELAAGTLRWRNTIDAYIEAASRRSVGDIDPRTLAVLRLGVYQLQHLSRVPAHAVVHESVEAIRALGQPRAAPFVNAALRAVSERRRLPSLPARPQAGDSRAEWVRYLTIIESHPAWLVERWIERHGVEAAEAWCRFNNAPPDVIVVPRRHEPPDELLAHLRADGVDAAPARYAPGALQLPPGSLGRLSPERLEMLRVQDEGSQLVARAAGVEAGERVLDLCAAPGGKTLVLHSSAAASPAAGPSLLVAADFRPRRVALLRELLRRASVDVPVVALDARRPLPFQPIFDCVLVDAPCSGLGTLRRDPDLKWTRSPDDLPGFAAEQLRMIRAAAGATRPGGRVVYATCSSEPEENGAVVSAFLSEDARYVRQPVDRAVLPSDARDPEGALTTLPFRDGLDAFYAAVLVRRAAA
jgi:16S rRNA (cytosine967-C5)-methyltransferase